MSSSDNSPTSTAKEDAAPFPTQHLAQQASVAHHTSEATDDAVLHPDRSVDGNQDKEKDEDEQKKVPQDDVHRFEAQEAHEREHYENLFKDGHSSMEAKMNAADDAEALPHHGFIAGDL